VAKVSFFNLFKIQNLEPLPLCFFVPFNLHFKSMLVFSLLKLNAAELLILVTELFFLK